jgi:predicted nucleic acid-binding protein
LKKGASVGFEVKEPGKVHSQGALVLDNSVAMRWLLASGKAADQRYAKSVRNHIKKHRPRVLVPYLWTYEAANVVAQYVRLGELDYDVAANTLIALQELCAVIIERETPLAIFECAEVHGVTAYDAAYLLLARSECLPLATLDKKMRKVARTMGIAVFGLEK